MGKEAVKIELTERQREILEKMVRGTHTPLHLIERAKIILLSAEGISNIEIARRYDLDRHTVKKWRNRWTKETTEINQIEKERPYDLKMKIQSCLSDERRSGRPYTFTAEQVAQIIALSLQSPESRGLPFSHWTSELLARQAIEEGIVESISPRTILRFFKRSRLKAPPM
jgi:transposase